MTFILHGEDDAVRMMHFLSHLRLVGVALSLPLLLEVDVGTG